MTIHPKIIRARRNRRLLLVAMILLAGGLAYAAYWWLHARFWVVTDNAFVAGNLIPVEADATGVVTRVLAEETGFVNKGDLLVQLDEHRARAALGEAEGELGKTVRAIGALFATRRQLCQKVSARTAHLSRVRHDVTRFRQALPSGSVSEQALQNAEDQMAALQAELREADAELGVLNARVGGTTPTTHPEVEAVRNLFIDAYLELARQRILAPASGYVAARKAQVGDRVHPGDLLLTLVPLDHLWVEANLRETEMRQVRPGQAARVTVDLHGRRETFMGRVEGLVPGTGSVFALLPPDNATGNFIHIVQRVPVRIALRQEDIRKQPLLPGLSTVTAIDVSDAGQSLGSSLATAVGAEYETDIFAAEMSEAETHAMEGIVANRAAGDESSDSACDGSAMAVLSPRAGASDDLAKVGARSRQLAR